MMAVRMTFLMQPMILYVATFLMIIITIAVLYAPAAHASTGDSLPKGTKVFPYVNPVYASDAPDPALLRVGDYFYTAVTGRRIMRSPDLIHWENVAPMFAGGFPAWADEAAPQFVWAPDMHYIQGKYVLYFSAKVKSAAGHHMGIGAAWADHPEGPYETADRPIVSAPGFGTIDSFIFKDDDGTLYMYWGSDHRPIYVQEMSPDGLSRVGSAHVALFPQPTTRYAKLVEAPWVIKRGEYYYLFWSGDHFRPGDYAVSVGRSTSPTGRFEMYEDNPILVGNEIFASPGHHSMIQDDAGQDWFLYHGYDWADLDLGRMLFIDQVKWNEDGWPYLPGDSVAYASKEPGQVGTPSTGRVNSGPVWQTPWIPLVDVAYGKDVLVSSKLGDGSGDKHDEPGTQAGGQASADTGGGALAVDGLLNTGWKPAENDADPWIMVDLGEARRVGKVGLHFGAAGIKRYVIETSLDQSHWQLFVDHRGYPGVAPYNHSGDVLARYVRVGLNPAQSASSSGEGEDSARADAKTVSSGRGAGAHFPEVRELRVYALKDVWIAAPTDGGPVKSPFPIEIAVDESFQVDKVKIWVEADQSGDTPKSTSPHVLYEGDRVPPNAVKTPELPDGRYRITLEVTDENEAMWRHEMDVEVRQSHE